MGQENTVDNYSIAFSADPGLFCCGCLRYELMNPGGKKTCVEAAIRSSAALPDHELL